jgi:hypothetical protein
MKSALSPSMTLGEFERGYWYAVELKAFGEKVGIPHARKLRKDELEKAIGMFLKTGKAQLPTKRSLVKSGVKDVDKGLRPGLLVQNYTSNRVTKDFISAEARKRVPGLKKKSGVSYRLNRWREAQLSGGKAITYGDLVNELIRLNQRSEPFERIPHGRYINFIADFLAAQPRVPRKNALAAWDELKKLDIPKDYPSWIRFKRGTAR